MMQWFRKRSLPARILVVVSAATLLAFLAVGVYATGTLVLQGGLGFLKTEEPRPPAEPKEAAQPQGEDAAKDAAKDAVKDAAGAQEEEPAAEEEAAPQQNEAEYVREVGEIQSGAVETFFESHNRLLLYDALTAADVEEMQANEAALRAFVSQVDNLEPPQEHSEHYKMFGSAINELYEAGHLAYNLAADPTAATQSAFDEYDRHVNEAAALLQQSNEMLGQNYRTIEGVQVVNPLS